MRIRLLQNCIFDCHFQQPIPGFEPFDVRDNPRPELREFQVFSRVVDQGLHRSADIVGSVSSRFGAKTCLDGDAIRSWIGRNPGKQVYVVNPWPQWTYAYYNTLERVPIVHQQKDILDRFQQVLDIAGVPLDFSRKTRDHQGNFSMSSFWFGTAEFWERIMQELVSPVLRLSRRELGGELHDFLYRPITYYGQSDHRAGALPFLLERATTLYLQAEWMDRSEFYVRTRQQVLDCCVFPFERDLVNLFGDEVDAWDQAGIYDDRAMSYFQRAGEHVSQGWLLYLHQHPVSFDNGNPRPGLPWFSGRQGTHQTGRVMPCGT
ncbi:MAG: hypothetical protein K0M67_00245 [Thiobacillus sp.]|nr:hypothetical protein [Thiobacillus sp.]